MNLFVIKCELSLWQPDGSPKTPGNQEDNKNREGALETIKLGFRFQWLGLANGRPSINTFIMILVIGFRSSEWQTHYKDIYYCLGFRV